jgi:hypothetical protein
MSDLLDTPPPSHEDGGVMLEVQRALGRIEASAEASQKMQEQLLGEFIDHKRDDKEAFALFTEALTQRDARLSALEKSQNQAKGAGKVILSLLGAAATFVGGAVLAVFGGWVSVKFK